MKCENIFCIHQEDGECRVKEISVNIAGMCDESVDIIVDEETLKKLKEKIKKFRRN